VGEKSPYTKHCAIVVSQFCGNHLRTAWLHGQWIRSCTLMMDKQADAPPCSLLLSSEYLWINDAKGVFHSSAQLFVGGAATGSHSWAATLPLILHSKELSGVVRLGLRGGHCWGCPLILGAC
jgi:hypothetical protein